MSGLRSTFRVIFDHFSIGRSKTASRRSLSALNWHSPVCLAPRPPWRPDSNFHAAQPLSDAYMLY